MDAATFYNNYLNAKPEELAGYGFALQDTVTRYPWFSLAHLLLFKSLCALGGDAYLSQAEKAAAYTYSRGTLFQIVKDTKERALLIDEEWFTLDFEADDYPTVSQSEVAVAMETLPEEMTITIPTLSDSEPAPQNRINGQNSASAQENTLTHGGLQSRSGAGSGTLKEFVLEDSGQRVVLMGADYFGKADMERVTLDESVPVDRFIKEQPRFTQVFKRPGEDIDIQEQEQSPALSSDDCVTETLARIYAQQGYNKLAISCYGKLILLYPKKSGYFAALIEEIKEKSNS